MDAIELLRTQHEEARLLFERILHSDEDRRTLLQQLAEDLFAHATIEEEIFYPAAYAKRRTNELFLQSVDEHMLIRQLVAELLAMEPDDDDFAIKLTMLKDEVAHHVAEEENEVFRLARAELSPEELRRLGEEMEDLFEDELAEQPVERLPLYLHLHVPHLP